MLNGDALVVNLNDFLVVPLAREPGIHPTVRTPPIVRKFPLSPQFFGENPGRLRIAQI